jgi:serine/threonine protein kinase
MTKKKSSLSVKPDDFTIKYRLGKGAYGDVFLAVKNSDGREYAMKQIMKRKL